MPIVAEEPKNVEYAQDRRSTLAHPLARSILRLAVVLVIAAAISGGWYLARKGFGGRTRARIVEELHRRGVEASIGRLTLNAFRGLVARNVRIFSYQDRTHTLAFISEIVLDINYAAFFHHQPFLNGLDVRNAEVTLPLKGPQGKTEQPQLRRFHAHIYFPPEQIFVSQAEGILCGVRVSATGQLIKRADYQPSPPLSEKERQKRLSILRRVVSELQRFSFPNGPPSLQVKFSGERAQLKLIGHAAVDNVAYKNLPLSQCRLEFSWDGERTWLRDIRIRHPTGDLRAEVFEAPNEFRLNIDGPLAPSEVRPFLSPEIQEFLGEWECPRPPVIQLAIRGKDRHPESWQGDGNIALDRTRFRGQWMNNATSKVHFADGAVTYENFHITRDEGVGTGTFTYDFAKHEVRVSNIKANVRPAEVSLWIDPDLPKNVAPYKFHQPPTITANGVYQFHGGAGTRLEINVDAPSGMDYVFLGKTLPFHKIAGRLLFTDDHLQIVDLKGGLFAGNVRGSADISLAHGDPRYQAKLAVDGVDFPRLTDLYYNYKTAHGQLSGTYDFTGFGDDLRAMQGSGKMNVANGDVFAIPVFGPLSGILNLVVPGAGYSIARNATADFTVQKGIIHTENFEVAGRLFSMLGSGDIYFMDDKLDFDVRIDPKGPGILLAPVYKLFEYKGEGSLKNPDWHPKRF